MVDPVDVQCSLSCSLVHLFHVLRECYSTAVCPSTSPLPPLPSKRPAEVSFEANKRLKECHLDFYSSAGEAIDQQEAVKKSQVPHLRKMRRRPTRLSIPEPCTASGFVDDEEEKHASEKEWEVEGCIQSHPPLPRKSQMYLDEITHSGFLRPQGVKSGACASTVVLKDGELHVANVGDCRVVLSRRGIANALTSDHHAGREDERVRIESSDSLAVTRSIGDASMKEWVISEPETKTIRLTPDCEFLVMASDGLWEKVNQETGFKLTLDVRIHQVIDQEAVDAVRKHSDSMKHSCKELVELACRRGNRDDITVMVVDLQHFAQ
ncbi:hypothetical protein BHM03_00059460 [Ensete ventricosum]|nr:hypothetical protein BHM03_00059460 [Ensete ventricosum]